MDRLIRNDLVIPDFKTLASRVEDIFHKVKHNQGGNVASYIPQLARVNPDKFAVSVCSIDGQVLNLGDTKDMFCAQSS